MANKKKSLNNFRSPNLRLPGDLRLPEGKTTGTTRNSKTKIPSSESGHLLGAEPSRFAVVKFNSPLESVVKFNLQL